jgi:hypothetical protein
MKEEIGASGRSTGARSTILKLIPGTIFFKLRRLAEREEGRREK